MSNLSGLKRKLRFFFWRQRRRAIICFALVIAALLGAMVFAPLWGWAAALGLAIVLVMMVSID
ncbi:hypothetical protein [Pseudidiomarina insulisalsae]|uniref:Uncharacterized protein n=1 Tax=Pseudidiomarina insulisalsae TaxID=575789 RepID=A0A432YF24_9GAMM|nr:hypothetical protein [Pseudidiomarina insulisalsae]RUO59551.1 hypothetical protein CWI71_09035 [Pseudidiomarina insulisalsae]